MKIYYIILFLLFPLVSIKVHSSEADSIALTKVIYDYYMIRPDSTLEILDDAEERKVMSSAGIDMLRAMVYGNMQMYLMQETCLRRVLASQEVRSNTNMFLKASSMMVETLEYQEKYNECINIALEGIKIARSLDNKVMEYGFLSQLGLVSFALGQNDDGYDYLNQVINSGKGSDNVRELSYVSYNYGLLTSQLSDDGRYKEAIEVCKERWKLLERMKNMPGPPPGYIDEQKSFVYSKLANLYQIIGQTEDAEKAYNDYMQTERAKRVESSYSILPYLKTAKCYGEVIKRINDLYSKWENLDTINTQYRLLLEYEAEAEGGLGNYKKMAQLNRRALTISDSIYARERNSHALELATVFNVNEKEMQLKSEQMKAEKRLLIIAGALVSVILLTILIVVIYIDYLRLKRRNRIAARQIDELIEQREELRRRTVIVEPEIKETSSLQDNESKDNVYETDYSYEMFLRMEKLIVDGQLFLQPGFGRNELLKLTGIHKNDLTGLLRSYSGASNLNDYLNRLRVEYSVKVIKENSHLSIESVAGEAGFNSRATFYRAFYKVFGMTPTEYISTL